MFNKRSITVLNNSRSNWCRWYSVAMKNYMMIACFALCCFRSSAQAPDDLVSEKGLTEAQLKAMMNHPDPDLLHNLATRSFKAISDERWSRYNQYQVIRVLSDHGNAQAYRELHCVPEQGDPKADRTSELADTIKMIGDTSYFLREPPISKGNVDGLILFSGPADANYLALSLMTDQRGCLNKEYFKVLSGLEALYQERSEHIVQSPPAPPAPTANDVAALISVGNDPDKWEEAALSLMREHCTDQAIAGKTGTLNSFTVAVHRHDAVGMGQMAEVMGRSAQIAARACKLIGVPHDQSCIDAKIYQELYDRMAEASSGH